MGQKGEPGTHCTRLAHSMTCYDVSVTFDHALTLASTASVHPSALSESTSCILQRRHKKNADVALGEFGRVGRHGRIWTNTIFWSMCSVPGSPFRPRLYESLGTVGVGGAVI